MKIIPTVFATNKKEFGERFRKLISVSRELHIDFMDGKFVKSKSILPGQITNLKKYRNVFEAHLMVNYPEKYLAKLKQKGFRKVIVHFESTKEIDKTLSESKSLKLKTFLAINPETKVSSVYSHLRIVDGILLMGVNPGKEHQKLVSSTVKKIQTLRKINRKVTIQIDGGVNEKTAPKLIKAGATILNSGSFISDAINPKEALRKLKC